MPTFNIVQVAEPGSPLLRDSYMNAYAFNDGAMAAREARRLSRELGLKLSAKIATDRHWRDREHQRFNTGEYIPLPWASQDWWYDARNINHDIDNIHYAHVSQKQNGAMIAYTASEEDGSKDKQTLIKPSKYLERFCSKALGRYRLDPRRVAASFVAQFAPVELKYAETAEDFQWVYEAGPESCMSHGIDHYSSRGNDIHPVTTYATGDLQVAYLEAKGDDEDGGSVTAIVARALVWPKHKTHCRIYGDLHRMAAALKNAGYVFGPPLGAKIKRVPLKGDSTRFVAPYIDAGSSSGGGSLAVFDEGSYLVIGRKDHRRGYFSCSNVDGTSGRLTQGVRCSECDEYIDQNNSYRAMLSCDTDDYRSVCQDCIGNGNFWSSSLDGVHFDFSTCSPVEMEDSSQWSTRQFEEHGAVCSHSHLNCEKRNMVRMHNNVMWSYRSFRRHGFTCAGNSKNYPNSEKLLTVGGSYVSREYAKPRYFQCDRCQGYSAAEDRVEADGVCFCPSCVPRKRKAAAA